jgi:GntP family gluconate:H+ symporter
VSQTLQTLLIFLAMMAGFIIAYSVLKMNNMLSMLVAAFVGALVAGQGLAIRHIVEGAFTFFDVVVVIITATLFIRVQKESGGLNTLVRDLIKTFYWSTPLLMVLLMFVIMLPGALTGSGTASIMALGGIIATVLDRIGIPKAKAVAFLALGGVLGLLAPPVNIPAMIISSGINMPYVGFMKPLFIITIPLGIICAIYLSFGNFRQKINPKAILDDLPQAHLRLGSLGAYLPLITVIGLMILQRLIPMQFTGLGTPMLFIIGTIVALAVSRNVNLLKTAMETISATLPVAGLLFGVGSLVQIMTLTGVRGLFVIKMITAPLFLLFIALAAGLPLSGSILGTYGAASVFGVPFMLSLLNRTPIIATVGISVISALATLTPPTAIDGRAAMLVAKYDKGYGNVLKNLALPWVLINIVGLLTVIFANQLKWML